jgi:hypothetical protein
MPLEIEGITYVSAQELIAELAISRVTFWRWRREGRIPPGHLYRGGRVVFTLTETEVVRAFANRIEPLQTAERNQLNLFNGKR